jgi:outer membrane protein OmpA-like peptidoglycan-associated protein
LLRPSATCGGDGEQHEQRGSRGHAGMLEKREPKGQLCCTIRPAMRLLPSILAAGVLALAPAARAEGRVSAEGATLAAAGDRALTVLGAGARGDAILRPRLVLDYAREPLVLVDEAQVAQAVVRQQLWLHAGATLALDHRFLFGADVPLLLSESGDAQPALPEAGGLALGDPRLIARARLLGAPNELELGAGLVLWIPVAYHPYAGDGAFRAQPFVALASSSERWHISTNVGFLLRKDETLPGVVPTRVGSALTAGAGIDFALDRAALWFVSTEVTAALTVGNGASLFDPRSSALSALVSVRHRLLGGPLELAAGFGPSLGQLPGAADYRGLFTLTYSPEEPPPPPDGDRDEVPDDSDMCPSLAGVPSNDPLMHGCPELPTDSDGDGIPEIYDACPRRPGISTGVRETHGCPPSEPPRAEVVEEQIVISQQVTFETGTAVLRPESDGVLDEVLRVLQAKPELELVEVAGHTDDTGTAELNQRLSTERAQAVVAWLVAHGVGAERLKASGYGQSRPIAPNSDELGRARNRRVEFHVLRRKAAAGAAP